MHKGTPYVYQGEELGMTNSYFTSIDQYRDIEALNYHRDALGLGIAAESVVESLSAKGRDNARTPMQWDGSEHAGFTTGDPWLPANPNKDTINAAAATADPDSVFHHFRRLIDLRHQHPVVVHGRFELLLPDHDQVWAFTRTLGETVLLVLANCSSHRVTLSPDDVPDRSGARVLIGTHGTTDRLELAPWESRVYLRG
jgi:oligo-1,6-glucosidase